WSNLRQAYFDVKVVSPFARSNAHLSPAQLFKNAERSKNREYKERIRNVEHADFNPLVFTCSGGMAPQSHLVLKRLAEKLSQKQNLQFSVVSGWLRCRLSFALLRTTLLSERRACCRCGEDGLLTSRCQDVHITHRCHSHHHHHHHHCSQRAATPTTTPQS